MSLRINHNIAALDAHRNLTATTRQLSSSMEKLSSGYRINRAADDPAGLVISEQFRAQIAGLNRAISNSEGSINMIQTAEGALNEMNNLLVSMRELAIHAANEGFNDVNQLAADQAEIQNSVATIDRIASNTQFGTKKLLDGTKDNIATITTANSSNVTIVESGLSTGTHSITATKVSDATASLNTTSLGISLNSTGTPTELTDGIHNIDVLQASSGATKYSSSVNISDAFGNGMTLGDVASLATIASAATFAQATTTNAGNYTVVLNYQENGEAVTGDQTLTVSIASGDSVATQLQKWNTAIANNAQLAGKIAAATLQAGGANLEFRAVNEGAQYSLKLTSSSSTATEAIVSMGASRSSRGVSKDIVQFTVNSVKNNSATKSVEIVTGASNKTYTSMSTLITDIQTQLKDAAAFGTVAGTLGDVDVALHGTDRLKFFTYDEGSTYSIKLVSNGTGHGEAENVLGLSADTTAITGTDALVSFDNYTNTVNSVKYASTSDYTLYNKAAGVTGRGSISVTANTALNGVNLGNLLLDVDAARFDVRLDAGPATSVTAGTDSIIYNADRTESLKVKYGLSSEGGSETINNIDQSLVFQIGGNVGQTARIALANMAASALGKNLAGNMFLNLSEVDVTTVAGAQDAQRVIDAAIDEVSTSRGTLGSFQKNTLESNLANLRIASQNLTASESSIRDTDMAKEMTNFVKNQILLQAGVAMLAQGNQVPQVVLSLFG
ncbi:MAG: flagellin [Candidatus Zixiibacteriota bacterium]